MKIFKALYSPMQRQRRGQVNLTSIVPTVESTRVPHAPGSSNTSTAQGIKPSVIPYAVNQPADLQLWASSFCPISLFGMNEFLDGDAKNITCSLFRMVTFIRQRRLEDKTVEDILQITKFGSVAWEFLSAIYEAGWDKLTTNYNNKYFRQCVSAQFNKTPLSYALSKKLSKGKQVDISRIPPPIPPRLSKSILEKSKFFRNIQVSKPKPLSNDKLYAQASKSNVIR